MAACTDGAARCAAQGTAAGSRQGGGKRRYFVRGATGGVRRDPLDDSDLEGAPPPLPLHTPHAHTYTHTHTRTPHTTHTHTLSSRWRRPRCAPVSHAAPGSGTLGFRALFAGRARQGAPTACPTCCPPCCCSPLLLERPSPLYPRARPSPRAASGCSLARIIHGPRPRASSPRVFLAPSPPPLLPC